MTAALLIADMDAPAVLQIIHWVGVGFIFLWFLGSCMKDGMWNNSIRCLNAFLAAMVGFILALGIGFVIGLATGPPDPSDVYMRSAIGIGGAWVAFIIALAILQACTDRLSQVKVPFHPIANSIGSFIFICGITLAVCSFCMPVFFLVRTVK